MFSINWFTGTGLYHPVDPMSDFHHPLVKALYYIVHIYISLKARYSDDVVAKTN